MKSRVSYTEEHNEVNETVKESPFDQLSNDKLIIILLQLARKDLANQELINLMLVSRRFQEVINDNSFWIGLYKKKNIAIPDDDTLAKLKYSSLKEYYFKQPHTSMGFFSKAQKSAESGDIAGTMENALGGMVTGMESLTTHIERSLDPTQPRETVFDVIRDLEANPEGAQQDPFQLMGRMMGGMFAMMAPPQNQNNNNNAAENPDQQNQPVECRFQ